VEQPAGLAMGVFLRLHLAGAQQEEQQQQD
jgi:hypothetical protein